MLTRDHKRPSLSAPGVLVVSLPSPVDHFAEPCEVQPSLRHFVRRCLFDICCLLYGFERGLRLVDQRSLVLVRDLPFHLKVNLQLAIGVTLFFLTIPCQEHVGDLLLPLQAFLLRGLAILVHE